MTCPSDEIVRQVRAEYGPRTLLSFSRGKDAIAAYLAIRDHFDEVIPYHLFLVPGLEFVEESLAYYERIIGRPIYNLPHPTFYEWLRGGLFLPPSHMAVVDAADLPKFDYPDVIRLVAADAGLPESAAMSASGVRAADSPMRRIAMQTHGAISRSRRQYYPIWDWNKARLIAEIEHSGIRLPVDYELFGRSLDGLDLRFLLPLKNKRPADYRRVLEWFPLADVEVWRYERYGRSA